MTITENEPRTKQFVLRQEKGDSDYGSCLWAVITFDLDRYSMTAESDCGNYAYCWVPTPKSESFLHLMCRIEADYLLGKISSRSHFNLEQSKTDTLEDLKLNDYEISNDAIEQINDIDTASEETFYRECDDILRGENVMDTFELIGCVKEYPAGAVKFAEIFVENLQPHLRQLIAPR